MGIKYILLMLLALGFVSAVIAVIPWDNQNDQTAIQFLAQVDKFKLEKLPQEESGKELIAADSVRVPIFVYHSVRPHIPNESRQQEIFDITPQLLEMQLKYLKDNNFNVISFDTLADYFELGKALPSKPVILSFDDGWENQFNFAFPVLQKYQATATFFVPTSFIGHRHFLNWQEIKILDRAGMTIGDHTKSHPYLVYINDRKAMEDEIVGSKKILEDNLGKPVTVFAYPFGHYTNLILSVVQKAGFRLARTTYKGVYQAKPNNLILKSILASDDFNDFVTALTK